LSVITKGKVDPKNSSQTIKLTENEGFLTTEKWIFNINCKLAAQHQHFNE
jgi:hypothetical protein